MTDPELQQSGSMSTSAVAESAPADLVRSLMEVQQQVRALKDRFRLGRAPAEVLPGRFAGANRAAADVEDDSAAQPESFHPLEERSEHDFIRLGVACAPEIFPASKRHNPNSRNPARTAYNPPVPTTFGKFTTLNGEMTTLGINQCYLVVLTCSSASS